MINIRDDLTPASLAPAVEELFDVGSRSVRAIRDTWDPKRGTPVFTREGRYTTRGWTEWTEGFQYGSALLLFEATGDDELLDYGRTGTDARMASHAGHTGVHDHGFNIVSTYGALLRMLHEGTISGGPAERELYELALKLSGATQAGRWSDAADGLGYVYSFNGPHSLFADTIRSMRSLVIAHELGHTLLAEQDQRVSLLGRALTHAETTARYNVYFGTGRDIYDVRGRVAHESLFNTRSGTYRSPSSQQGYSPFTTWTRGLAWIITGFAEQLEYLDGITDVDLAAAGYVLHNSVDDLRARFLDVALATSDFYISMTPIDGVPYWDTGAPGLSPMGDYLLRPADPFNLLEPVDSSAAAIAAQGILRLGTWLNESTHVHDAWAAMSPPAAVAAATGPGRVAAIQPGVSAARQPERLSGDRYVAAALTIAQTLFGPTYLSTDEAHQGILLHSVYHRPGGWDYVAPGQTVPNGESSMWGDYHALELGVMLKRLADGRPYQHFFDVRDHA